MNTPHSVYLGYISGDRNGFPWLTYPHDPLGNGAIISFRRFGDDLLGQIVVNQLVRTEIKFFGLCAFSLFQSKNTMQISAGLLQDDSYP